MTPACAKPPDQKRRAHRMIPQIRETAVALPPGTHPKHLTQILAAELPRQVDGHQGMREFNREVGDGSAQV